MGKTIRFNENSLIAIKNKLNEIMVGTNGVSHNDVYGNVKLYHGTTIDALLMIMESGVMSAKRGKQHGETYGVNWFSLKNGDNFNKGALFSIEVPGDVFNERFRMMNSSEAVSKDDDLDITGFNLTIEKICGLPREAIKNAYDRYVSNGERYPLESIGYLFDHFIEKVQDDDVLFPSILYHNWDKYYPMIMKNILGDSINESVAKEFAPVTEIGAEPNSPAGGTFHHIEQEQTDEGSLTEGIKFNQHGLSLNDDKILKKYNLKDLILSKNGNYVTLNKIVANELGKGNGSRFMEELTKMADKNGWTLALTPDTSFGGSSVGRLQKFYRRYGFNPNKGRNTDFNTRESMIRRPLGENKLDAIKENLESEISSSEVDLSSFKKRDTLPPGIWKDEETLNSKVRLKLLDIADDFWKFVNLTWVEPKGIIITGSICNFNWSKFSDIDLHLVVDFNEIDSKTEFVKQYLDSKKNEWNAEHEELKIMGFPVELYTQDVSDNVEAGGIYDLEENAWIRRPNPHTIKSIGLEKFDIKRKAAEIMTIIDEMYKALSSTDDGYEVSKIGEDASYLWEKVKSLRKKSLTKCGENGAGNIVYKVLRRKFYLDKLWRLKVMCYDKLNSITESKNKKKKYTVYIDDKKDDTFSDMNWKRKPKVGKGFYYGGAVFKIKKVTDDLIYAIEESKFDNKEIIKEYLEKDYNLPLYKYFKWASTASSCEKARDLAYYCSYYIGEYIKEIYYRYSEFENLSNDGEFDYENEEKVETFCKMLEENNLCDHFISIMQDIVDYYELPSWCTMDFNRIVKNEWCIHFGSDSESIAKEGFTGGTPDIESLAYTNAGQQKHYAGYNFAFLINDRNVDYNEYGDEAVIFRTSGVEIYHYGDNQNQVIFWGPNVKSFIPIHQDNGDWVVYGQNGQVLVRCGRPSEIALWATENLPQYRKQIMTGKNGYIPMTGHWDNDTRKYVKEPYPIYRNESKKNYFNGITESTKKYLKVLKEEFAMDGSSEGNPYEKRWKAERDALKNFVANYGKLMQSKEDNKMGRLYKVYYDETMSNLIGYNYCICVQWDEMTMKPKSTVYIRALDKFTPFIRRNLQFDNRGMDNQRGTADDIR